MSQILKNNNKVLVTHTYALRLVTQHQQYENKNKINKKMQD